MRRILSILFVSLVISVTAPLTSLAGGKNVNSSQFDWNSVMNAIMTVESNGNPRAVNGNQCGAFQITPILVSECNQILKSRKSTKRYTLSDRFSVQKSKEMFVLIQSAHNPMNDIERAIRMWNGGINYSVKRTQRYFEKVMKVLNN